MGGMTPHESLDSLESLQASYDFSKATVFVCVFSVITFATTRGPLALRWRSDDGLSVSVCHMCAHIYETTLLSQ